MQHFHCFLVICLLLAFEIRAIDDGMRSGRKLRARDETSELAKERDAEAPDSSTAIEDTGQATDQTFNCSKEHENSLNEANSTTSSEYPCEEMKPAPPPRNPPGSQRCQVSHNRKFKVPDRNLITVVHTPSARICCELCGVIQECYSWWRRYSDGRCYINRVFTHGVYSSNAAGGYL